MRRRVSGWAWGGLLLALVLDLWLRGHAVGPTLRDRFGLSLYPVTGRASEPLDCDEAIYAYIGRRMTEGATLYRDLTENKPPLGYAIYAAAPALGGLDEFAVRLVPVPFVLATLVLVWWLGLRLGGPLAATAGALAFAAVSTDPYLYADGAEMEPLVNLFAAAGLAAAVAAWRRAGRGGIITAGALFGLAALVKQPAALHLLVLGAALLLRRTVATPAGVRYRRVAARVGDATAAVSGFAAVWLAAALAVWWSGAGAEAVDDVFRYGRALATDTPAPAHAPSPLVRWLTGNADPTGGLPWPFGRSTYLVWWGAGTWPFWLVGLAGTSGLVFGGDARRRLVAAWTLSAAAQVVAPGLYWPHYYMLPLPGLAVAAGVFLADHAAGGWSCRSRLRRVSHALIAALAALGLVAQGGLLVREYLLVAPQDLVRDKGGYQWVAQRDLGLELARRSTVWRRPTLFVWGWQGTLYYYSGLPNVTRQVFVDDLMRAYAGTDHPQTRPRVDRMVRELRADPPSLVFAGYAPFPALRALLDERYLPSRLTPVAPDGRGLWVERSRYAEFETFAPPASAALR